jgi:hypothetical protein
MSVITTIQKPCSICAALRPRRTRWRIQAPKYPMGHRIAERPPVGETTSLGGRP